MSDLWNSPHLILLLALVSLTPLVLRRAWNGGSRFIARAQTRKLVRVAADVDVHITDLLGTISFSDALKVIRQQIAVETNLMTWRALRIAQQAERDGVEGATLIVEDLQKHLDTHTACSGDVFHGFTVPNDSPLMKLRREELTRFNHRMHRLRVHWQWATDWLYQARKAAPPRS